MSKLWMALIMTKAPTVSIDGGPELLRGEKKLGLPDGAAGMVFVFETKSAARAWHGKDVQLLEMSEPKQ